MLTIQYNITIGATSFSVNGKNRLIELWCDSAMNLPINTCRMRFTLPKEATFKEGDAVKVQLGYSDALKWVFTGAVQSIAWQLDSVQIEAQSSFQQLVALHTHAFFENASAGDIVKGLAGEAKVKIGKCTAGLSFPFYAVGNHRSAWQVVHELAMQCGFDFYANAKDELIFAPFASKGAVILLEFGKQILKCQLETTQNTFTGVEVFGESPASFGQGAQAATWFTKKEVKGLAGGGSNVLRQYLPAARTQELAKQIATALWQGLKSKKKAKLIVLGNADIELGATVELAKMPVAAQNGKFKVTGCCHTIHKNTGFLTQLTIIGL